MLAQLVKFITWVLKTVFECSWKGCENKILTIFATYVLVTTLTLGCFMYQFLVGILTAVCAVKIGWNPEFFQDIIHRVKADG